MCAAAHSWRSGRTTGTSLITGVTVDIFQMSCRDKTHFFRLECPLSPGERPQILPIARLKPRNGSETYMYWISVTKFFSGHTNIFMKIDRCCEDSLTLDHGAKRWGSVGDAAVSLAAFRVRPHDPAV